MSPEGRNLFIGIVSPSSLLRTRVTTRLGSPMRSSNFPAPFHAGNAPPVDRHHFLSYPPSQAMLELKWAAEVSADEPAAKRIAFDPDADLPEVSEDADAPTCPKTATKANF
uniref:Uncharacterized protein n=1 Tax=Oryza brachyantha TaxID=4533 RepID=J3KZT9_ORYBR